MEWSWGRRALSRVLLGAACALALAGCNQTGPQPMAGMPRGATVAFESIDGPPQAQFRTLVQNLSEEAQSRQLAVISREQPSVYRVRGYLAANVAKDQTTISWVWDVFDKDENRALRIAGEETAQSHPRDAWTVADNAMLKRIAETSMDQLASFLTSPEVAPGTAPASPAEATLISVNDSSPEAAGIFRIPQAKVDPAQGNNAAPSASFSARETLSLSAQSHQP
jgi:hypothetical protein